MKIYVLLIALAFSTLVHGHNLSDHARPDGVGVPTKVYVTLVMIDLDDINTADQNFTANVGMRVVWKDHRLAHDSDDKIISYPLSEIWHPRLQWINQQKVWETFPQLAEVSPDGTVTYVQRVWGQFSQPLNLQEFPFDQQNFALTLIASNYTPDQVQLIQNPDSPSGIADVLSIAGWKVQDWQAIPETYQPFDIGPYSAFVLRFTAQRDWRFYTSVIIFPLMLIVAMSWVVFWIDPKEGGTQIGVAMTSMLTLIAFRFAVAAHLPQLGYLTKIDLLLMGSTVLVFASLVEVILTSYLARTERLELARRIDVAMRPLFPATLAVIFLLILL